MKLLRKQENYRQNLTTLENSKGHKSDIATLES